MQETSITIAFTVSRIAAKALEKFQRFVGFYNSGRNCGGLGNTARKFRGHFTPKILVHLLQNPFVSTNIPPKSVKILPF